MNSNIMCRKLTALLSGIMLIVMVSKSHIPESEVLVRRIGGGCGAKKGFEIAHTADLRRHWALRIIVIYDDHEEDEEENLKVSVLYIKIRNHKIRIR